MTYSPLDLVENYLCRFVAYPSEHALVAHVLWIAHTHLIECFDTTPRLAFMSAEKESGKTRALEVTELFVRDPLMAFSASSAVLIRLLAARRRTLLYDEIDSVFGNVRRQEANGELCAFLNAGYRRGAKSHKCSTGTKKIKPEEFDAFAAVAVAGLRDLPDMLASRCIFIRLKRRAPDERIEPFRHRYHPAEAKPIAEDLAEWCAEHEAAILGSEPKMPAGIEDRAADIWEPLLGIADEAGDDWPKRARAAAVYLTNRSADETLTAGVELLAHIAEAFGDESHLATVTLLERLRDRDESPWRDIRGKALDDRGLARRLKGYGIKSRNVRIGERVPKGYAAEDFHDAWSRYLPSPSDERYERYSRYKIDNKNKNVADVAAVAQWMAEAEPSHNELGVGDGLDLPNFLDRRKLACPSCDGAGCPWCQPEKHGLPARRGAV